MVQGQPISVLIADADAEEVKLLTVGIRAVFPGCRVEAVYAPDEVMAWVERQEWEIVFLDEVLLQTAWLSVIPEIRKRLPHAAMILQTDRNDVAVAMQAIRAGADHCLYKKSPTYSNEFAASAKALLEQRQQPVVLLGERMADPYSPISEEMTEIVYELDPDGRFVDVGPGIATLLGYRPEELIGLHFSTVLPAEERKLAEHRLNERRTGERATRNLELRLKPKGAAKIDDSVDVELTAMGRYDPQRHMVGTVGVIRDIRRRKRAIQQCEAQLQQQFREREEQRAREYHEWEQQLEQELHRREEDVRREFTRREEELAHEHARLKTEMKQELARREQLQLREEELRQEYAQREQSLAREQDRLQAVMQQELDGLKSEMQQELERRQALQRREEDLCHELKTREERFAEEKRRLESELEREVRQRDARLRQEYQQQVEKLSEERHRLEVELERRLQEQQTRLRQDAELQEEQLHRERTALQTQFDRLLEPSAARASSSGTVLIVESQTPALRLTRTLLEQHGYSVIEAPSANEAMTICQACQHPIHLLLTDVAKPGTINLELAQRLTALRPEMKVLFLSGYVTDSETHLDLLTRGIAFLPKPFSPDTLIRKIADTVDVTQTLKISTDPLRLSALP